MDWQPLETADPDFTGLIEIKSPKGVISKYCVYVDDMKRWGELVPAGDSYLLCTFIGDMSGYTWRLCQDYTLPDKWFSGR